MNINAERMNSNMDRLSYQQILNKTSGIHQPNYTNNLIQNQYKQGSQKRQQKSEQLNTSASNKFSQIMQVIANGSS